MPEYIGGIADHPTPKYTEGGWRTQWKRGIIKPHILSFLERREK